MVGSSKMVSFGEAMIRFLPQEDLPDPMPPSAAQKFLRCARAACDQWLHRARWATWFATASDTQFTAAMPCDDAAPSAVTR